MYATLLRRTFVSQGGGWEKFMRGMKYAYASKTGHVEKIVRKLGLADALKIIDGTETVDEDYILFTYTTGKGTPKNR